MPTQAALWMNDAPPLDVTQPLRAQLEHQPGRFALGTGPVASLPDVLGPYRVLGLLARGGMGGVYLGEHAATRVRVALKVLDARFAAREPIVARLLAEREITRRVAHTGLVRILGGGRTCGVAYLAMELVDGEDLGALTDRGRIELGAAAAMCAQIADAAAAMHDANIIHCDLKPDNVMVEYRHGLGGWPRVKVLDFGVARIGERASIAEIAGTPCYMAPEQWRGYAEPRSDVYGLGCMLYELITGRVPFDGSLPEVMTAHCEDVPAPIGARRRLPDALEPLVMHMLAKQPGARPHMAAVARTLSEIAHELPPGAAAPAYDAGSIA